MRPAVDAKPGQPRILRRVIKRNAKKEPKVVRDYVHFWDFEKMRCAKDKSCYGCPDLIIMGDSYVKASNRLQSEKTMRLQGRLIVVPQTRDYRPGCLPDKVRKPILRLLCLSRPPLRKVCMIPDCGCSGYAHP